MYGVVENKGEGKLDHLGNPPDMSKYLKKIACGADFWIVENKGGGLRAYLFFSFSHVPFLPKKGYILYLFSKPNGYILYHFLSKIDHFLGFGEKYFILIPGPFSAC